VRRAGWGRGASPAGVEIFPDPEALSRAAATLTLDRAREALASRARFLWALSGGSTPRRTYELLAHTPLREEMEWSRVEVFWGDERCVPPEDPRSNYRLAREALLDRVPIPEGQIHPMTCHSDPWEAARRYEALLRRRFLAPGSGFDLVFLGLGADGHTASLFPGHLPPAGVWVAVVTRPGEDFPRLTLTPEVLNRSRLVVFLVAGRDKAPALQAALTAAPDPSLAPARLLTPPHGEVRWLVDREAAALL